MASRVQELNIQKMSAEDEEGCGAGQAGPTDVDRSGPPEVDSNGGNAEA